MQVPSAPARIRLNCPLLPPARPSLFSPSPLIARKGPFLRSYMKARPCPSLTAEHNMHQRQHTEVGTNNLLFFVISALEIPRQSLAAALWNACVRLAAPVGCGPRSRSVVTSYICKAVFIFSLFLCLCQTRFRALVVVGLLFRYVVMDITLQQSCSRTHLSWSEWCSLFQYF